MTTNIAAYSSRTDRCPVNSTPARATMVRGATVLDTAMARIQWTRSMGTRPYSKAFFAKIASQSFSRKTFGTAPGLPGNRNP
jgi:hypothetical protein